MPKFILPPLPEAFMQTPLRSRPYFIKFDLSLAFYHITLHPTVTLHYILHYYRFVRPPFGIRTAPFVCEMLIHTLIRPLRAHRL